MIKTLRNAAFMLTGLLLATIWFAPLAEAFTANDLIDDTIFDNANAMGSAAQIDAWLNNSFGATSCISTAHGFSSANVAGYNPIQGFLYGSPVSAGTVIYNAAQAYGINPQVLLATLQKEQSLVSGNSGCSVLGDTGAMGYGCPDGGKTYNYVYTNGSDAGTLPTPLFYLNGSPVNGVNGTCVNSASKAGFSEQVIHGAWLLSFGRQRSEGNTSWAVIKGSWDNSDDPSTCYGGPMTQGSFKRCSTDPAPVFYDGYTVIDGSSTHMDTGATASLYWYTPHFAGNQNFVSIFSSWFGNPTTPCESVGNISATPSGYEILADQYSAGITNLAFTLQNNTGSACAEAHLWAPGYSSWAAHFASAKRSANPSAGTLINVGAPGSRTDNLAYVLYNGGSGLVEIHKFSPNLQLFPGYYDVATNLGGVSATSGQFVSGDFFGHGYKQLAYILYSGSSGRAEVHAFDPSFTKAIGYYDVPTNLAGISASSGIFVAGDFFGRGYDQLAYVVYSGGSGAVEVHVFNPAMTSSTMYEVPTNLGGTSQNSGTFVAGDFLGRGSDQLAYILYNGSSGKVEVHTFSPDLRRAIGYQDIATNLPGFVL